MIRLKFGFRVLYSCVAAAFLTACGGSQPPIGAPGAMTQSRTSAIATHTERGGSWMLPEAKIEDLLYAVGGKPPQVYVLTYPAAKRVGTIDHDDAVCADKTGDVFMTVLNPSSIVEYRHAGAKPIGTLRDPDRPYTCAVDPLTGSLAVSNPYGQQSGPGNVVIYKSARGKGRVYTDPSIYRYVFVAYDATGDLFVEGNGPGPTYPYKLAELLRGSNNFTDISVDKDMSQYGGLQWDGEYLAIWIAPQAVIYRLQIEGSVASVVATVSLKGLKFPKQDFFIQGGTAIIPSGPSKNEQIDLFRYPQGGRWTQRIRHVIDHGVFGSLTISLAPK